MSLDVYLTVDEPVISESSGIFIRENGATKEVSINEWNARFPGIEPVRVISELTNDVFHANITHNLNSMAELAGLYRYLWRPDELNIVYARELRSPLATGLVLLTEDPDKYKALNPANGWGKYETLVNFVAKYLSACIDYPNSKVNVSR